jgi:hypothetical protein
MLLTARPTVARDTPRYGFRHRSGAPNRAGLCSSRDRELTDYGVGLTDLVKVRGASSDGLLESSDYDRSGCIASDRARAPPMRSCA